MKIPGGKGSWIGLVLFLSRPQVSPPSNLRELGKLVMGVLIHRSGNMEDGSNWTLLGCRRWWNLTYHPDLQWCHIVCVIVVWNKYRRYLYHGWNILYRIVKTMSWSPVWSFALAQMVSLVWGLVGPGLGLALLMHGVPRSTRTIGQIAFLW